MTFWSPDQIQPPCIPASLKLNWPGIESCKQEDSERKIKQKHYYDSRQGVKELQPLQPGDGVWVSSESKPPTFWAQQPDQPRSYTLEASGSIVRPNRSALLPYFQESHRSQVEPLDNPILRRPVQRPVERMPLCAHDQDTWRDHQNDLIYWELRRPPKKNGPETYNMTLRWTWKEWTLIRIVFCWCLCCFIFIRSFIQFFFFAPLTLDKKKERILEGRFDVNL